MKTRFAVLLVVPVIASMVSLRALGQSVTRPGTITIYFPDLFYKTTQPKGDTTFAYEYQDKDEQTISIYDITDADQVKYVKYFKVFRTAAPGSNSVVGVPSQYIMQYWYVHPLKDRWVRYNHDASETIRYKIYKDKIVGADSVTITDPQTKAPLKFVYKYYKTEITERSTAAPEHDHEHTH